MTTQQGPKKPYQLLTVIYKNLSFNNKVEEKKILPFGAQGDTFKILADAQPNDEFEVAYVKNDKGYNDWVSAVRSTGEMSEDVPSTSAASVSPRPAARSNYETPEERQARQVYIVRQSSITAALGTLSIGQKAPLNPQEVISVAKIYESYVFNGPDSLAATETLPPEVE